MIELKLHKPNYFLIPIDNSLLTEYSLGFSLGDIFKVKGRIITSADELLINTKFDKLKSNIDDYMNGKSTIEVGKFTKSKGVDLNGVYKILPYRVFDNRHYYDSKIVDTPCLKLTKHESIEKNYYLNYKLSITDVYNFSHILITKKTSEAHLFAGKLTNCSAPLYLKDNSND